MAIMSCGVFREVVRGRYMSMKASWHISGAVAALAGVVMIGAKLDAEPPRVTIPSIVIRADDAHTVARAPGQTAFGTPTPLNYATGFEPTEGFTARDGTT